MTQLDVRLFGGFEVRRSGESCTAFPTRKARALFALLARHPGRRHGRESLATMLWPDSAEPEARSSLRQALKLLRRALAGHGNTIIVGDRDALALAPEAAVVDVDLFERLQEEENLEALEQAAALYQGEFLEGMTLADGPFDDWATVERMRLSERALDVFSKLLAARLQAGETEPAIDAALRLLALDPLQEHVHRHLMQLYLELGRRGSALEQYRVCRTTLERELGTRPEPETERLYQEIRRARHAVEVAAATPESTAKPEIPVPSRLADPLLERPAVAVLPFANLSGDPEQTYFSDGLSEDIITSLAGWRTFPLIASNSTLACRDEQHDLRAVADSLDARYIVDGSVRRAGNRMRVTARLIESQSGRHLWADRFDFDLHDILAVQEEAAQKIAAIVEPELEQAESHRIIAKRTEDLTAWDCYLQGAALLHRLTPGGNTLARTRFEQALELDPEYSDAYTGLATCHSMDVLFGCAPDRAESTARAMEAAQRAVALDSNSSMAHLRLGAALVWSEDFDRAIPETELAVELNPSNAHARMALGNRLDLIGRTEDGIAQLEHGLQLNPRDPRRFNYMGFLARAYITLGEYETACRWARQAVQLRPDHPDLHFRLAVCLGHLDRTEEARAALRECERLRPGLVEQRKNWKPYSDDARNELFFAGLRRTGLLD